MSHKKWSLTIAIAGLLWMLVDGPTSAAPLPINDLVELNNGAIRIGVSPQLGRIVEFGLAGEANVLWINSAAALKNPAHRPDGSAYYNFGGEKVWPVAQCLWPRAHEEEGIYLPDETLDGRAWRLIAHTSNKIIIQSEVSRHVGVRVRREISLVGRKAEAVIRTTFTQVEPSPFPVQIWSITQVANPAQAILSVDGRRPEQKLYTAIGPNQSLDKLLKYIPRSQTIIFNAPPTAELKSGTYGRWLAARTLQGLFLQVVRFDPQGCYLDDSNLQVYLKPDNGYLELETLGGNVHLKPGQSISNTSIWRILPISADESLDKTLERIARSVNR